ncbi:MAG: hypothetical protein JSS09_09595 [Verrucomicrobia bacterium]|nr:hypothetical protein [Verrucomicrobiota bacterium]
MDNSVRKFEDALLGLYISETEPFIEEIDRSAENIVAEANRFKREKRKAKKNAEEIYNSSLITDSKGNSVVDEWFGERAVCYSVDPSYWMWTLKTKIEEGVLAEKVCRILGIWLDHRKINLWRQRHIRWQGAAQILWVTQAQANTEDIKKQLLLDPWLFEFLEFNMLSSVDNPESRFRDLEDQIRSVNPKGLRVGRPKKVESTIINITPVSLVYNKESETINTKALYIIIVAMAKILLKMYKKNYKEICSHPVILAYKTVVPTLEIFIDVWIQEAIEGC